MPWQGQGQTHWQPVVGSGHELPELLDGDALDGEEEDDEEDDREELGELCGMEDDDREELGELCGLEGDDWEEELPGMILSFAKGMVEKVRS